MFTLYYDSGTTNTRIYLLNDAVLLDQLFIEVGTRDSAIAGSNEVLLRGLYDGMKEILRNNDLHEDSIRDIYMSGMVTNPFGIIEVPHMETPISSSALAEGTFRHFESTLFGREIFLIPGAKTTEPEGGLTLHNIHLMGNTRGEEIEVMGMLEAGVVDAHECVVIISPGSHTHLLMVDSGNITDISSHFTGELHSAISRETILGGEIEKHITVLDEDMIRKGYELLSTFGLTRALYVIHSTKVFDKASDQERAMLLLGLITGSVISQLKDNIRSKWNRVSKVLILSGPLYIMSYEILINTLMPELQTQIVSPGEKRSFALEGYKSIKKLRPMEG